VRIGLLGLTRDPLPRLRELALLAEAVGYDDLWLADERFFRDVYVSLTVAATQTHRIRLGPCVTDPYSRHPALTAMAIASLAEAYPGRVALGIGAGISGFAELGIARIKPARAIREAVEVIRLLLAGDVADSDGEVIRVTRARFAPDEARAIEGPDLQPILEPVVTMAIGVEEDRIRRGTPDPAQLIAVQVIVCLAQAMVERAQLVAIPLCAAVEAGRLAEDVPSVWFGHEAEGNKTDEDWWVDPTARATGKTILLGLVNLRDPRGCRDR
jgi:Luciferase-like monooxygenase